MDKIILSLCLAIFLSLIGVIGDFFIKLSGNSAKFIEIRGFVIGLVIYAITAFGWFYAVNYNMAKSIPITASCGALRLCSYLSLNSASFHFDKVFQLHHSKRLAGLQQPVAQPAWDERDFDLHLSQH